jgi:hypothetical protein
LHGKQVECRFVNLAFRGVDQTLTFENHLATGEIAIDVSLAGAIHRLFRQSAHAEQPLAQIVEPLLKTRAHYPDLSLFNSAIFQVCTIQIFP